MSGFRTGFVLIGLSLVLLSSAAAQSVADFGRSTVEVVSEWRGQDRGDGSGSYSLVTILTDPSSKVVMRHELGSERDVEGQVSSKELFVVFEGGDERYRAESDPVALGPFEAAATAWVLPFDAEFHPDPRSNYRAQQKRIAEVVHAVAAEAKVSTKGASDGRTTATIEIPGEHAAGDLARRFVGVRQALREADLGMAKLIIKGKATSREASASVAETP